MLTIIHGDDIVSSRKYFSDIKQKHADAVLLDEDKVNLTDLAQIFEGGGLFNDSKTVFIEQFLSKRARGKKSVQFTAITQYLDQHSAENMIVLWENKELEKSAFSSFKKADVKIFKLPQALFLFLDSIKPGNGKRLISLFHQTIANTEEEMVFFMLVRQIRLLLALIPDTSLRAIRQLADPRNDDSQIDELKRMAPWQKDKLQKQASLFSAKQLIKLYNDLFQIELGQKTGTLSGSLTSTIDFLLLEI